MELSYDQTICLQVAYIQYKQFTKTHNLKDILYERCINVGLF